MSDSLEAVALANDLKHKRYTSNVLINNNQKRVLKSKENLFKPKCNKELKKKLRKYKLRRDGNEDQDVLDVSKTLVTSLRIKSPNNPDIINKNNKVESKASKPSNYLFKMVRKRKTFTEIETNNVIVTNVQENDNVIHPSLLDEVSQNDKQMNAFKLMMDSRNKSIGNNSPGKEKCSDDIILQETEEKKAIKTKRMLSLQKMAENKGCLKKKEIEEYRELCIKKKMLKRTELFKNMIMKHDNKISIKDHSTQSNIKIKSETKPNTDIVNLSNNLIQSNKSLKLCDIFSDTNTIINENKQLERVSDEDIEFLKKLSPSIRKRENMLCYFKKVDKDADLVSEQIENNSSDENGKSVIKVKFTPKRKKKTRILKSSQDNSVTILDSNSSPTEDLTICVSNKLDDNEHKGNNDKKKQSYSKKVGENTSNLTSVTKNNIESENNEDRPKRNSKRPIKYTEDVLCFSSDEELHIFTPKKKRNNEISLKTKIIKKVQSVDLKIQNDEPPSKKNNKLYLKSKLSNNKNLQEANQNKVKSDTKKELKHTKRVKGVSKSSSSTKNDKEKKVVKLAPIFMAKPQLSQTAIEAKQRFLKSGVPEKLKKSFVHQTNNVASFDKFHSVHHVQQNNSYFCDFQGKDWFTLTNDQKEEISTVNNYSFKSLLISVPNKSVNISLLKCMPEKVLKCIKRTYPKFPVYRTYHTLRGKCKGEFKDFNYADLDNSIEIIDNCIEGNNDNPEKLNWCDKYKPTSSKQIIGNFETIKELKRWLETWSEKLIKDKNNGSDFSDMSDFYSSDMDSRDANRTTNNVLIVTGPTGSGKTSSVYAIAAELAIKVIEVNASSKRNGKIMLQDLQEATQSHKVDRAKSGTECSQKSQEMQNLVNNKKRGRPKKMQEAVKAKKYTSILTSDSQESVRTGMSLILIDDADIVFDQDDGFCSAISQLIQSSKRPVILVTSSLSCPHLQRFLQNGKIIKLHPLLPRMLGTWLDIMCLADIGKCCLGFGEKLLDFYKGDIRKTVNCLQFYMNIYKNSSQIEEVAFSQVKSNIDDENSSMSWADSESMEGPLNNEYESSCNIDKQLQLFSCGSSNIFDIWWGLPNYYNSIQNEDNKESNLKSKEESGNIKNMAEVLDSLSTIDYFDGIKPDKKSNITSSPWYNRESASLLEGEDFNCYNEADIIGKEISNMLMMSTISEAKNKFKTERSISGLTPSMSHYRERDKLVSRHNNLSSYLNPSAILDRRATALDYWSSCRTICRIEKSKTDYNIKRNNRFCHYLKSLNILCKNDFFDNLADSLT